MKKIFITIVMVSGICVGSQSLQISFASAQTSIVTTTIIPLTNQVPFTNTVVPPSNLSEIQLGDVLTLLLTLQTNIEKTLPVLDLVQSNAFVASVIPAASFPRTVAPGVTNSAGVQTSLAVKIGANTFSIDAPTLQALFILRDNLQKSLVDLQALNGTTPSATNSLQTPILIPPPITNLPPPFTNLPPSITNFSPGPLTNTLAAPPASMPTLAPSNLLSPF